MSDNAMQMRLTQMVQRGAQTNGKRVVTDFAGRRHTWDRFADRVARLATGLDELDVKDGDRVAILALNSDRYLEFFFAVPWAGAVFVPINTRLAPPEIAYWLNDSGSEILFVDDTFVPLLPALAGKLETVRQVIYLGDDTAPAGLGHYEGLIQDRAPREDAGRGGDDLAGLFYTGGTTGVSKGVMLSHANLVVNALNITPFLHFDPWTNWLHAAPMFHLADGAGAFAVAMAGGAHCFIPSFEPVGAMAAIQQHRPSHCVMVPTMVNMVVNHPSVGDYDLTSLQKVLYGASPMPRAVIDRARHLMPGIGFIHGYGQTEAAPFLTALDPRHLEEPGAPGERRNSIGHSGPAIEVRVLDQTDCEVPAGTVGEICARGMNVMQGYWKKPELTAETLRNGWLHTGDGGYMDEDGFLYIVDRVKDMIISGGENVYSAEVENAIHQHPDVIECAVIGIPHEKWGEQVHAIVRLREPGAVGAAALIAFCHALIANYKCPRGVAFVTDPLPLSGAGKILKTELRLPYWAGHEKAVN
ncbi:MAG: long-chain-fatty-acid--CoA ligase [Proteobacteria bacterium]|nr:long-chain-fatty-acid--CoA ligase [Pseudomonadota bacterium]